MFEAEQELYEREGIEWTVLKYDCNETVLDLLSLRPHGILRMLDDEAQFPKVLNNDFPKIIYCDVRYYL